MALPELLKDRLRIPLIGAPMFIVSQPQLVIATQEAAAVPQYKEMIVQSNASDIVYSNLFTGVHGSYLKGSVINAGMDPDNLPDGEKSNLNYAKRSKKDAKAWRDIWGAGQGVGNIDDILPAFDLALRMETEYDEARLRLGLA
jgi:nitronate monooxygenase